MAIDGSKRISMAGAGITPESTFIAVPISASTSVELFSELKSAYASASLMFKMPQALVLQVSNSVSAPSTNVFVQTDSGSSAGIPLPYIPATGSVGLPYRINLGGVPLSGSTYGLYLTNNDGASAASVVVGLLY